MNLHHSAQILKHFKFYGLRLLCPEIGQKKGQLALAASFVTLALFEAKMNGCISPLIAPFVAGPLTARFGSNARDWEQHSRRFMRKNIWDLSAPAAWVAFDRHIEAAGHAVTGAAFVYNGAWLASDGFLSSDMITGNTGAGMLVFGFMQARACRNIISRSGGFRQMMRPFMTHHNG